MLYAASFEGSQSRSHRYQCQPTVSIPIQSKGPIQTTAADIRHARNAARAVVSSNSYNNKLCRPFSLTLLQVSHTPLSTISNQAFSVTTLCLEHVISTPSLPTFMTHLKARLFSLSFPWVHAQSLCCENICHSGCYKYSCYLLPYESRQSPSMADYHTWNGHHSVCR